MTHRSTARTLVVVAISVSAIASTGSAYGRSTHTTHAEPVEAPTARETPATTITTTTVTLDGVRVRLRPKTRQVVTVNHTAGWHARVSLWVRRDDHWRRVAHTGNGRTGYGGLVAGARRKQGTGSTPLGTFGLISSFGTHRPEAGWGLPYRRIRPGDYWVEDNGSSHYNRYRNKRNGGFRWWLPQRDENSSERLSDYPVQHEYAVVTSFNRAQVRHRGAGIFLHVNGRGATAGCVSVPRWMMRTVLGRLDPALVPQIAIGR